jgi:hypothetical protein
MVTIAKRPKFENGDSLVDLVAEAAAIAQQVRELDTLEAHKLTPAAFLREAMAIARTDAKRLADLRKELDSGKPGIDHVRQAFRSMVTLIKSRNCTAPPKELRRLTFLLSDSSMAEIAALRSTSFELFAAAAQFCAEKFPEVFGTAESSEGIKRQLLEAMERRDRLYERIGQEYGPGDTETREVNLEKGTAKIYFRGTDVLVYPQHDCGKRLVEWHLSHAQ